jgi:hypothetical protein
MALTKLNIPDTIKVGFQNRQGTYTGKLAYVVYKDKKGVLRKEKSWNGWKDDKIPAQEFENVPTDGFVLNKKVGDHGGGWNSRKAWVRIYDPRDFEFEISVQNLLFILEECSAIKGKGLEGEFVYSWDRADLVLLPVASQNYKESVAFTALQDKKVTKKDMKEGCLYLNKDNEQVMYLGRQDWYHLATDYGNYHSYHYFKYLQHSRQHVFVSVDGKSKYWIQKGFTKLAAKLGDDPSPLFPEEFEKFKNSVHGSEPVKLVSKLDKAKVGDNSSWYNHSSYVKSKGNFYPVNIRRDYRSRRGSDSGKDYRVSKGRNAVTFTPDKKVRTSHGGYDYDKAITREEVAAMRLYKLFIENKQGTLIQI